MSSSAVVHLRRRTHASQSLWTGVGVSRLRAWLAMTRDGEAHLCWEACLDAWRGLVETWRARDNFIAAAARPHAKEKSVRGKDCLQYLEARRDGVPRYGPRQVLAHQTCTFPGSGIRHPPSRLAAREEAAP